MKNFLFKLILFLIPIPICLIGFDYFITYNLRNVRTYQYATLNDIFGGKIDADIIINGSSQVTGGISPHILENTLNCKTYNIGSEGQRYDMQYHIYNAFREKNTKPKYIIQHLDYIMFRNENNIKTSYQFFPYIKEGRFGNDLLKSNRISYWDKIIPFHRYFGKDSQNIKQGLFQAFGLTKPNDSFYNGYRPYDYIFTDSMATAVYNNKQVLDYEFDEEILKKFEEFLKDCEKSNIKVIFIIMPTAIKDSVKFKKLPEFMDIFHKYSQNYNIPLLDLTTTENITGNLNYFMDNTHLNSFGAKPFTLLLADKIKQEINLSCL